VCRHAQELDEIISCEKRALEIEKRDVIRDRQTFLSKAAKYGKERFDFVTELFVTFIPVLTQFIRTIALPPPPPVRTHISVLLLLEDQADGNDLV